MSQTTDQPEEKIVSEPAQAASPAPAAENAASPTVKTGNLADTDPEYKHKHGEHKHGEHHHHHHH
ncbi:MAG: hypothetical protein IJT68_02130, partial [Lentisphaeria bacterium]|nr:hypothetical protein [Lentisphaeria bacterium]